MCDELLFAPGVRFPNLRARNAKRAVEREVVLPPVWHVAVEQLAERFGGPSAGVNAVGDRVDDVARKHQARNLTVALGDAVDVVAQVEREERHVQHALAAEDLLHLIHLAPPEHARHQLHRKLVVPRRHRCVRREDAELPHGFDILVRDGSAASAPRGLVEQLQREEARVAFIHVKAVELPKAKPAQHPRAADAEDRLLAQPISGIATVEMIRKRAVVVGIAGKVRV